MSNRVDLYKYIFSIQDDLCKQLGFAITSNQWLIISKWFNKNFETLGQEHHIQDYVFEKMDHDELKKYTDYSIARKFADKLIDEKNYIVSNCDTEFTTGKRYEMCILKVPSEKK